MIFLNPRYRRLFRRPPFPLQMAALLLLLTAVIVAASAMGYIRLGVGELLRILLAEIIDHRQDVSDNLHAVVVWEVRLPRILTAAIVGGGLALSGVVFQGILLNPLADPYTLGVSAGAAFGACLALLLELGSPGRYGVPMAAFAGASATLFVVLHLSSSGGGFSSNNLIMSGIIVAAILSAGISLLKYLADEQVAVMIFWLMGGFASRTWTDVGVTLAFLGLGSVICLYYARDLNLLALGDRTAATLGVETRRVTLTLLITASMIASACVAVSGIIGFVGLLAPHLLRGVVGPDNRKLMPASLLGGGLLLLGADTVNRALLPMEVPIGVLTALIGGPFFCYIFRKRQMRGVGR